MDGVNVGLIAAVGGRVGGRKGRKKVRTGQGGDGDDWDN